VPRDLDRSATGRARHHGGHGDLGQSPAARERRVAHWQQPQQRSREQRRRGLADRAPGAVRELADRAGAHAEIRRDPLVALAVERVADDHVALVRRQR
jgi:hypothetical protein